MGLSLTTNTHGVSNLNVSISQTVGDEKFKTLAGLFANMSLEGAPFFRGVFGEIQFSGNSLGISYAHVAYNGINLQNYLRLNIFRDPYESIDLKMFHNETRFNNSFGFRRFGGNLSWTYFAGHSIGFGFSQSTALNTTAMEAIFKLNLWKSEKGNCSLDLNSNLIHFIRGPLEGHQDVMASLTISFAL
uniref:Attacin C-terminal domain-containing protein n=1 Tax=Stomoxys calcitrans TaxID=35570 RepID=A0A1I8NNW5_STOCA